MQSSAVQERNINTNFIAQPNHISSVAFINPYSSPSTLPPALVKAGRKRCYCVLYEKLANPRSCLQSQGKKIQNKTLGRPGKDYIFQCEETFFEGAGADLLRSPKGKKSKMRLWDMNAEVIGRILYQYGMTFF